MEQREATQPGGKQSVQKELCCVKKNKQSQERHERPEEMLFRCFALEDEGVGTEVCRKAEARISSVYHAVQGMRGL